MSTTPTPQAPEFAVYGLAKEFTGLRWVVDWDGPQAAAITLGHGPRDAAQFIAIQTFHRNPAATTSRESGVAHEAGVRHAARTAVVNMVALAYPLPAGATTHSPEFAEQLAASLKGLLPPLDGKTDWVGLGGWDLTAIQIDLRPYAAHTQHHRGAWAMAIDLREASIAAWGPPGTHPSQFGLADVSDDLADYLLG